MAKRTPTTFAKRQREIEQKKRAEDKRKKSVERKLAPKTEEPVIYCKPFIDDE